MASPADDEEHARRRTVAWALKLTRNTPLAPLRYEQRLLAEYERGELSIDEVVQRLEASVFQLIYHSRVVGLPDEAAHRRLLGTSRIYNILHDITGLLVYGNQQYVQVLEGDEQQVRALFARIMVDTRHRAVELLSAEPVPGRHFADWAMDFGHVDDAALEHMLRTWQTPPAAVTYEPRLQELVAAYHLLD